MFSCVCSELIMCLTMQSICCDPCTMSIVEFYGTQACSSDFHCWFSIFGCVICSLRVRKLVLGCVFQRAAVRNPQQHLVSHHMLCFVYASDTSQNLYRVQQQELKETSVILSRKITALCRVQCQLVAAVQSCLSYLHVLVLGKKRIGWSRSAMEFWSDIEYGDCLFFKKEQSVQSMCEWVWFWSALWGLQRWNDHFASFYLCLCRCSCNGVQSVCTTASSSQVSAIAHSCCEEK